MARNGVSVIEMRMLRRFELDMLDASRRRAMLPSVSIFSIVPSSRFATPSCLSGAVN